jgi:uncharacterized protein with von Willebrand factor type A (vWA) domain
MNKYSEIVRLADSEPLVITVSALTDFLWPEFVRETKPQVKYFTDRFEIRQLSRFGKELFELFYSGGDVKPLVSLEDAENYFRAKQGGQVVDAPKGFKPENTFWNNVLLDVTNSPVYSAIKENCLGKHFESGNTAVCVLNELSEVLNEMLSEDNSVYQAMTELTQNLEDLRQKFVEAMQAGDTRKAAELRQEGKELGQQIENILDTHHSRFKADIEQCIEKAQEEAQAIQDSLNSLAGDHEGFGVRLDDIKQKKELAKKLSKNKKLMQLAKRLGGMKQAWTKRFRAKKSRSSFSDIVGAKMSDDITKAFPSEIALAATKKGKALFAYKLSQKTILTKDFEAKTHELDQGPVVMYVDISGSMAGDSELWSKAIAYVVAEQCSKDNREIQIHLFDSAVNQSIVLEPRSQSTEELLQFLMEWFSRGGTSFDQVMKHAYGCASIDPKADVLIITDGECQVTDATVRKFNIFKDTNELDVHAFCIGKKSHSLARFCDSVHLVDTEEDAESSELIQNAIS